MKYEASRGHTRAVYDLPVKRAYPTAFFAPIAHCPANSGQVPSPYASFRHRNEGGVIQAVMTTFKQCQQIQNGSPI